MNVLQDALKIASDALIKSLNPTEVTIGGTRYTASVSYTTDLNLNDFSERQQTGVQLSIDDFATEPPMETEIVEIDANGTATGRIHRIKKVTFQGVAWLCECEMRHNAHKGPFK